jgi:hypothetical protein
MRRAALGAAVAALLVIAAVALGAGGSAGPTSQQTILSWTAAQGRTGEREHKQDLLGYWGQLTHKTGTTTPDAYYRAKCVGLTDSTDSRMVCDIVVFIDNTGSLVLEGIVKQRAPTEGLFATASPPKLAVTGTTIDAYMARRAFADITQGGLQITILP